MERRTEEAHRVVAEPLSASAAQDDVDRWLAAEPGAVASPGQRSVRALGDLVRRLRLTGNFIPDAQIAAQAIELGVKGFAPLWSA